MRKKLFWSLVGFALAASVFLGALLAGGMYLSFSEQMKARLVQQADTLGALLAGQQDEVAFLTQGVYTDRVTLVDVDGSVLYDSRTRAEEMENHLSRQEVAAALSQGQGWSRRDSATLGETSFYYALRLASGRVLRLAGTQKSVMALLWGMAGWLALGALLCAALAALVARPIAKSLMKPINAVDLDEPLQSDAYEELTPMLRRMDAQKKHIASQMEAMRWQQDELETILSSMREGLVALDEKQRVLVANPAAREILAATQGDLAGTPLAQINRSETLLRLLKEGGSGEMTLRERHYRVSVSPIQSQKRVGQVLLLQDVSAQQEAEESRRQFSANVSHELRTPLTTITGYAEMLETGFAKPEDTPLLAGKISRESRRMLQLIEDILRLSRLDEGITSEMQPVELLALARQSAVKLEEAATARQVILTVEGAPAVISGDQALLEEMLLNLMENGIKYNRPGGTVTVAVGESEKGPYFRVADTGVGIPPEHQRKVFERFYRVDKSRSKETGGTGLGLSIVKHGAQLHHADIQLNSTPEVGTEITVTFPRADEQ